MPSKWLWGQVLEFPGHVERERLRALLVLITGVECHPVQPTVSGQGSPKASLQQSSACSVLPLAPADLGLSGPVLPVEPIQVGPRAGDPWLLEASQAEVHKAAC